ncbi:hypothetical protein GCM10022389_20590 [Flavobacterium cheonanense]|uniref:Uncharacterized protein n=2 Tax=Flavobacterium TaxID=237 RepID=A0ABP7UU54_9FLAO
MKFPLKTNRIKRKDTIEENNLKLNIELDNFGIKLIKVIGIVGLIIGFVVLIVFYFWVFKKMF